MLLLQTFTLLVIISLGFARSEKKTKVKTTRTLADRLTDKLAWFGEAAKNCTSKSIKCFNLRRGHYETILHRAGITKQVNLTKRLKVTFQAKKEGVDVCGKTTVLDEVPRFELPADGRPLFRKAEDYRNPPNVSWYAEKDELYSLILYDVGFFKIRGWWYNIKKQKDNSFKGEINIRYSPPANPTPNTNPILIMLLRQYGPTIYSQKEWHRTCASTSPSEKAANRCRSKVIKMLSELNIVGLQVYYTEGYSQYEQYRACTESLPCHEDCIEKFARYVTAVQKGPKAIKFLNLEGSQLDHYVNVHFYTLESHPTSELPYIGEFMGTQPKTSKVKAGRSRAGKAMASKSKSSVRYVDVRARPGDDMQIRNSDTLINANKKTIMMNLEIGVPVRYFQSNLQVYSVLIVDQDAPGMSPEKPYGHYYMANLQLPEILDMRSEYQPFIDFTPHNGFHRYYILLFSQEHYVTDNILGPNSMGWNMKLLSDNHRLRAVSWMIVNFNDDIECPPHGEGGCLRPQPFTSEYIGISYIPIRAVKRPTHKATSTKMNPTTTADPAFKMLKLTNDTANMTTTSKPTNGGHPCHSVLGTLVCFALLLISSFPTLSCPFVFCFVFPFQQQ